MADLRGAPEALSGRAHGGGQRGRRWRGLQRRSRSACAATTWRSCSGYGGRLLSWSGKTPGAADVDTSEEDPRPEFRVSLNRKAAGDLGLDLGTVATTVRGLVAGEVVSQFEDPDGDSYDVRLRVDPSQRSRSGDLLELDLPGQFGRDAGSAEPGGRASNADRRPPTSAAST